MSNDEIKININSSFTLKDLDSKTKGNYKYLNALATNFPNVPVYARKGEYSIEEVSSILDKKIKSGFKGQDAESLKSNNPFNPNLDRVAVFTQKGATNTLYKSGTVGIRLNDSGSRNTTPTVSNVFNLDSDIYKGVTDRNSIRYKGKLLGTKGRHLHEVAMNRPSFQPNTHVFPINTPNYTPNTTAPSLVTGTTPRSRVGGGGGGGNHLGGPSTPTQMSLFNATSFASPPKPSVPQQRNFMSSLFGFGYDSSGQSNWLLPPEAARAPRPPRPEEKFHGPFATRDQLYPQSIFNNSNVGSYHSINKVDYMRGAGRRSAASVEDVVYLDDAGIPRNVGRNTYAKGRGRGKGPVKSNTGVYVRPRVAFDVDSEHVVQSSRSKGINYDASEINTSAMSRIHSSQPYAYSSFNKMYTGSSIGSMWTGIQNLISSLSQPIKSGSVLSSLNKLVFSGNLESYGKYGGAAGASYASGLMQGTHTTSGGSTPPPNRSNSSSGSSGPSRPRGGGPPPPPPPPPPPNKPPSSKRGGFSRQMAEQGRHAFAWGLYTAPLTAAMALGARVAIGDRYSESAAHGLIGVGVHDQADRDRILAYGRRKSELLPYTHPQDHINVYKEVASGLGVDPTTENIPSLMRTSDVIQTYSKYSMQEPATAARSIARQTTMVKVVAPEFKDKTNQETAEYVANVLAGIYKTSSVKGEEMDTAMRYGGAALMGPKGWGWDFASTAAFNAQMIQSGVGASQIGVTAKHMATGIPFYEQAAKLELIKRKIRENAANPKIGWTRNALPFEMTKRGYWQKPENKKILAYEASKQAAIYRAGPEAALSKLHEHSTTAVKLTNAGFHMGEIVTQQMMPTFELFAQQSKEDVVGNVAKMQQEAAEAAKKKELERAKIAQMAEGNVSASVSKITEGWVNSSAELGQGLFGGWLHRWSTYYNAESAASASKAGDAKTAATQYSLALAAYKNDTSPEMRYARERIVYGGIINELKNKGASKSNKVSMSVLPEKLREYLSSSHLSYPRLTPQYSQLKQLVSDLPERDTSSPGISDKDFKLPDTAIGGIPGRVDIREAIEMLPEKIGKEILKNSPDIIVNASNGVEVAVSHSNKPKTGIPAAPSNAPQKGDIIWGQGGRVVKLPGSSNPGSWF